MKKLFLLMIGALFALQLTAVAKENKKEEKQEKKEEKRSEKILKRIEKEEHESHDISPTHGKGHDKKDKHDDNRNHDKH